MKVDKRSLITAGLAASAGLAAGARRAEAAPQPAAAPKATGRTMLDSPNYFGTASKGGGFKANWARSLPQISTADPNYRPRRLNKAIELWEDNQVVYYHVYMPSGAPDGYEEGRRMAKTYCDAINYEMENGCMDFANLRNFMQGLVDGGPTPSGHRTPMVFVTLPAPGYDGSSMRANAWQIQQSLAAGAHGVLVCEMHSPEAGEIAIAAARYKFTLPGVPELPVEGLRGAGSQAFAAHIWGMPGNRYLELADTWPHNPKGEISMGFKVENRHGAEYAEQLMAIKGLAFAEPGPSDNSWSIMGWDAIRQMPRAERAKLESNERLEQTLERIRLAAKKNNVQWLGTARGMDHNQSIDAGMRMLPGDNEQVVMAAREYTKRRMPA
jgi:4-hydroxy-2-oxoheptanedioate aldolase